MEMPPKSKREHLRQLVAAKNYSREPLSAEARAWVFRGWHERGYLPHCDKPGLIQLVTFRLWDAMPASRRGQWEPLLRVDAETIERSNAPHSNALRPSLFDVRHNVRHDLRLRLHALRAAVVQAHAHRAGFHVATADDQP